MVSNFGRPGSHSRTISFALPHEQRLQLPLKNYTNPTAGAPLFFSRRRTLWHDGLRLSSVSTRNTTEPMGTLGLAAGLMMAAASNHQCDECGAWVFFGLLPNLDSVGRSYIIIRTLQSTYLLQRDKNPRRRLRMGWSMVRAEYLLIFFPRYDCSARA